MSKSAKNSKQAEKHEDAAATSWFPEISIPTVPMSVVGDLALMGVHLGIGLAAMAIENAKTIGFEAIDRGAKLEKEGRKAVVEFEREQVATMKDYLNRRKASVKKTVNNIGIEAQVEEALKTFDVPTRDDIRELNLQIAALSDKITAKAK